MLINSLESAAAKAKVGPEDGDMPGEGVRSLAAKLRRKLHKTPPRWQVRFPRQDKRIPLCCFCCRQQLVVSSYPSTYIPDLRFVSSEAPPVFQRVSVECITRAAFRLDAFLMKPCFACTHDSHRKQVNLDVLSWLLRPVPFVTGLPAPVPPLATPTPFETTNGGEDSISNSNSPLATRDREYIDSGVVPGGGDSDARGAEKSVRKKGTQSAEVAPRGGAYGNDPSVLDRNDPAKESRAVPVPVPHFQKAKDDGGGEGTEGSKNRAGFHSYDETHQVM